MTNSELLKPRSQPQQIEFKPENFQPDILKQRLLEKGFNVNLSAEHLSSLQQSQFRNYTSGRGLAMSAVLGERIEKFEQIMIEASQHHRFSIKGDKHRGARQFAADLIAVAVGCMTPDDFVIKSNFRLSKHTDTPSSIESSKITSMTPEAAQAVLNFFGLGE